jgi:hypothetical protein
MSKHKEAGVLYATACPSCRVELALGWLPNLAEVPWVQGADGRRPWPSTRPDGVYTGPVACRCGAVKLELVEAAHNLRAAVSWAGVDEPILVVNPYYGSPRDQVR